MTATDADWPRLCLRHFRPPQYAQVLVVKHRPMRVMSPAASGRVVMAKGPWRTSGEWRGGGFVEGR